jgi:hypothetical protein
MGKDWERGEGRERGKDRKGGRTGKLAERGGRMLVKKERRRGGSGIGRAGSV